MSIPSREKKCKAVILKMCPVGLRHNKGVAMAAAERARNRKASRLRVGYKGRGVGDEDRNVGKG